MVHLARRTAGLRMTSIRYRLPGRTGTAESGAARAIPLVGLLLVAAAAVFFVSSGRRSDPGRAPEDAAVDDTAADLPDPFVLAFLPSQRAEELMPDARRLGGFLAERLGVEVEVVVPTVYEPIIEGLRFGHVHAAFLDGGPAWIAHERTGSEVILAEVNDGRTFYWAEAFVLEDSPIQSLEDLPGNRVAFTSRTGSSGFIMPVGSMIRAGLIDGGNSVVSLEEALNETFAATIYAGGYKPALTAVLEGRADVAFGAHDGPERFLSPEERERLRTLHRFGQIPSHSVVVARELSPAAVSRLRDALLELNGPDGLPLLRAIYGVDGLTEADTESHLGEFGAALSALPGMDRTLLDKTN